MEQWTAVDDVRDERGCQGNGVEGGQRCGTGEQTFATSCSMFDLQGGMSRTISADDGVLQCISLKSSADSIVQNLSRHYEKFYTSLLCFEWFIR